MYPEVLIRFTRGYLCNKLRKVDHGRYAKVKRKKKKKKNYYLISPLLQLVYLSPQFFIKKYMYTNWHDLLFKMANQTNIWHFLTSMSNYF